MAASVVVDGPTVEVEQLWYDKARWASWIDGFGHLERLDDHWPQAGARRLWDSRGARGWGSGGRVSETVTRWAAREGQTLVVEDARLSGVQRVIFTPGDAVTQITVQLELEPKERLAPGRRWWLRRQLGDSLRRTLTRFTYELAAERR